MRLLGFLVGLVLGLALLAGCGNARVAAQRDPGEGGSGGSSTTSAGSGGDIFPTGSGGGPACDGVCVGIGPDGFEESPSLMWFGAPADAPPCPDFAPLVGFEGFADLTFEPHQCPACACSPASCSLPEAMHASAAKCPGEGAPSLSWDASPAWRGVCSAEGAIPAGLQCEGVPCVQSLTIDAPTVEPCQPLTGNAAPFPDPSWGKMARECRITVSDTCPIEGFTCTPTPPEGFTLCVNREGDDPLPACPTDYPHSVVVYAGPDDSRTCAPCACGEAEGAACSALVSFFSDEACGALLGSHVLTSSMDDACFDLPPGVALGSKEAALTVDQLGACPQIGGEPLGDLKPGGARTYCCQSEPVPPQ